MSVAFASDQAPQPTPGNRVWDWLTRPSRQIKDFGEQRRARLLAAMSLAFGVFNLLGAAAILLLLPGEPGRRALVVYLAGVTAVSLLAHGLSRTRHSRLGAALLTLVLITSPIPSALVGGGNIVSSLYAYVPLGLVFASLFFSGLSLVGLSIAATGSAILAIWFFPGLPAHDLVGAGGILSALGVLLAIGVAFRNNLEQARLRELEGTIDELKMLQTTLEQRVEDRTRDIALASEVGRQVSQVRDLDDLLAEAVELIRARFSLYYAQVYLTDSTGTALLMAAGTGTVGVELKRRAFRLPIGSGSINGTAAATRQVVIVGDAAASPIFRPNPMLPGTRSELAVPLIAGDQIVGVLDLQSDRSYTFNDENKVAFLALAGQLAVTIQNNLLFSEVRQGRAAVEEQARRLARAGWQEFLDAIHRRERFEYIFESSEPEPIGPNASPQTVTAAIQVAGEPVGSLTVQGVNAWGESEAELVSAVAQQVARQIENIRLLAQAEQYRERAEEAARRLTYEGWQELLSASEAGAYVYDGDEVVALPADPAPAEPEEAQPADLVKPIAVHGATIGEVIVEGLELEQEGAADIVDSVVAQLSSHIENLRLSAQTQEALAETRLLYDTSARLNAASSIEETLRIAVEPAINAGANDALLFTFDLDDRKKPEWMEVRANWVREGAIALPAGVRFFVESYPLAPLLGNLDSVILIDDPARDPRMTDRLRAGMNQANVKALAALPLLAGAQPIGLILIHWATPHKFGPSDAQIYKSLATQAAIVVDNRLLFAQTQAALAESRQLYEASRRLSAAVSLQDVITTLVESAAIPVIDRAVLMMLDRDVNGGLRGVQVAASWHSGHGPKADVPGRYYTEDELHGVGIFQIAEPTFLDDAQTDPRVGAGTRAMFAGQNVRGVAALPLWIGGRQLGVFLLQSEVPHHFTESEIRPLTSLTQQMAIAVENRQLFEQTQSALNETEDLYKASARLNASGTPQETLLSVTQSVARNSFSRAVLYTFDFDPHGEPANLRAIVAVDAEMRPLPLMMGKVQPANAFSYSALWLKDAEPLVIENTAADPRVTGSDRAQLPDVGSLVVVPLRLGSRWIGVITATWPVAQRFTERQVRILHSLGAQAATVLDNQLLLRTTQKRAERETIINRIAQKIQNATSVESAVQTAVRELGQVFKARRTVVEIGKPAAAQEHAEGNGRHNGQNE